jgi:hypothetical protein
MDLPEQQTISRGEIIVVEFPLFLHGKIMGVRSIPVTDC